MPKAYWFNINNAFSPLAKICIGKMVHWTIIRKSRFREHKSFGQLEHFPVFYLSCLYFLSAYPLPIFPFSNCFDTATVQF